MNKKIRFGIVGIGGMGANHANLILNNKIEKDKKSFYESNHLSGDVDFVKLIKMILKEEKRRSKNKKINIPMRPDHGHALLDDQKKKTLNPGYTAIGRLMGLSELRGIIKAVQN